MGDGHKPSDVLYVAVNNNCDVYGVYSTREDAFAHVRQLIFDAAKENGEPFESIDDTINETDCYYLDKAGVVGADWKFPNLNEWLATLNLPLSGS